MITQTTTATFAACWRDSVPVLHGAMVSLREVEPRDAESLHELTSVPEVARFISQPPDTCDAFQRFIAWARDERRRGRYICFAVVPHGMETAVGLFHLRRLDMGFDSAEWGFVLGSGFWGTGVFLESAELVIDFAFDVVGVARLEARIAFANGRGRGAMRKVGAVQEAVLRRALCVQGQYLDQTLWSIVDSDRLDRKAIQRSRKYVH